MDDRLIQLRHDLHVHPELSSQEEQTAGRIVAWAGEHLPSFEITENLGGHGVVLQHDSGREGPHVLFRCELDALPIAEESVVEYRSANEGVSHACGHDGHMAILCGLGLLMEEKLPQHGAVSLLFQPAEETGEGARRLLEDERFLDLQPDFAYALHNLPGTKMGQVLVKGGTMCLASCGVRIGLRGQTSHAAEPSKAISPLPLIREMLDEWQYVEIDPAQGTYRLSTLVHLQLGEGSFGITPGNARIALTLRAERDEALRQQIDKLRETVEARAEEIGLQVEWETDEFFSAVTNGTEAVRRIEEVAGALDLEARRVEEPFRWSEDFGLLSQEYPGALFCLGSGEGTPNLHHPSYDFPDELIETGARMFYEIWQSHL